ncbi:MAG: hypothetical protein M3042_10545 [Actinomycetota bacterium]|nr:hypothetical protein [Actinomycetota bacterium]
MRTTVGPLAPEVYWRRRLAILGVLIVAVFAVRAFAMSDTSRAGRTNTHPRTAAAGPQAGTSAHPWLPHLTASASPSPHRSSPAPAPIAGGGKARVAGSAPAILSCADSDLSVTATTDARTYRVGAKPKLTMTVRNTSDRACRRDLGAAARELIITSGTAHTWSSADCQAAIGAADLTLLPAGALRTFSVQWSGQRSLPGCAGARSVATAGTYRLQARLGTLRSATRVFHLI